MGIDNFRDAIRDISTHIGVGANKAFDSTFTVYIVDVIDDPKRVSDTRKEIILKFLHNKEAFDYLPGKSIIFAKVNKYGKMRGSKVFYALPFMSPHFSQPINAGELAWVFNDNGAYYWISRKTSLSNLEDINYTSGLRSISVEDTTSERTNIEVAKEVEQTDEKTTPDFPSITDSEDEDMLSLLTFFDSHSSKSFVGEPTPIVKPAGNEFLLQGGNNSSIKLGNSNYNNTGNIELTAGITSNLYSSSRQNDRGYFETSRAVIEAQNEHEGMSNYNGDASRIFISAGDIIYGGSLPTIAATTTNYFVITNSGGGIYLQNTGGSHISINSSQISITSEKIILSGTSSTEPATKATTLETKLLELASILTEIILPTPVGPVPMTGDVAFLAAIQEWAAKIYEIKSTSVEHD
jgi:hypothetical protein